MSDFNCLTIGNIDRVWVIECSRCSVECISWTDTPLQALDDLSTRGWSAHDLGRAFCRQCKPNQPTPARTSDDEETR